MRHAAADSHFASAQIHQRVIGQLIEGIDASLGAADERWSALRAWLAQQLQSLQPQWNERRRVGRARECHGDLHLANAGWPVVIDAAFLRESERISFAAVADALRVPFTIIDCRASAATLRERIAQRHEARADASEADDAVLERLQAIQEPLAPGERAIAIVADSAEPVDTVDMARQWFA